MIVLLLGTLGLVFFISFRINTLQYTTALTLFMVYAALLGVTLSSIFVVYTGASITRVFFISAASFGALSLYGYTTQRDLTGDGLVPDHGPVRADPRVAWSTSSWPSGALSFAISVARRRRSSPA